MRFFCENSVEDRAKRFYRNVPSARRATIAQSVEQPPCKRQVGSSILPGGFRLPFIMEASCALPFEQESRLVAAPGDLLEGDVELRGQRFGLRVQGPKVVRLDAVAPLHLSDHQLRVPMDRVGSSPAGL